MENQKASVRKIALNYGLILALLTIGLSVIVWVMGVHMDQPWWQSLLNFIFMTLCIVYGLKAFKKEGDGFMSLGDAIKTGLAISLVAGLIGSIFTYIFITFIEPEFITQMLDAQRDKMIEDQPNMTQEQMDMAMGMTEKFMSPWFMFAMGLIASLFFGFIISLVAGLIMKQNRPSYE
jgi:energy-converting hydrogenase Eha subunit A